MISVDVARARIITGLAPVGLGTVALAAAYGRVLGAPVLARVANPPADVSAMDGFAVRAVDAAVGARLKMIGAAPAGHPFDGAVGQGEEPGVFAWGGGIFGRYQGFDHLRCAGFLQVATDEPGARSCGG